MTSSRPRSDATVPALAVKPLWNTTAASVRLKAASRRSSSMCSAIVPAIGRTDPVPTPNGASRLERALAQHRVRGQPEIVVGGEVDDRPAVDRGARRLLAVEHAQRAETRPAGEVRPAPRSTNAKGPAAWQEGQYKEPVRPRSFVQGSSATGSIAASAARRRGRETPPGAACAQPFGQACASLVRVGRLRGRGRCWRPTSRAPPTPRRPTPSCGRARRPGARSAPA